MSPEHRIRSKGSRGRASGQGPHAQRGPPPLGKDPLDKSKGADSEGEGQSRRSRPHLPQNCPQQFRHLSLCRSLLPPVSHLGCDSGDPGSLDWLSLGWDTQGNLRPQAPLSRTRRLGRTRKQARRSPGQGLPPQPAKPLGDGGGRTVSAVPCASGPPAPSPGTEDDTPATPDKGLCASLHPPVPAACALPPRQQAPRLREAHPPLLAWVHSLAWLPTTT